MLIGGVGYYLWARLNFQALSDASDTENTRQTPNSNNFGVLYCTVFLFKTFALYTPKL